VLRKFRGLIRRRSPAIAGERHQLDLHADPSLFPHEDFAPVDQVKNSINDLHVRVGA